MVMNAEKMQKIKKQKPSETLLRERMCIMDAKKLLAAVAVAAVFSAGTAFAGERHGHNSGVRLATDIVNLVKSVVSPTVVVQRPVVVSPAPYYVPPRRHVPRRDFHPPRPPRHCPYAKW